MGPGDLRAIMSALPSRPKDAALLVGLETGDDAGVYQISAEQAIVCTADFITPVVDDPFLYGQIAAANSLSDVYAMAGRPLAALALCLFPKDLPAEVAREILAGGESKITEAGAALLGGHTVRNGELFYGLSVTGVVHPKRITRNVGLQVGDALILTKPIGSGLVVKGLRKNLLSLDDAKPTLETLATLNRAAGEAVGKYIADVHAVTDITGFGLSGHALGMAKGSRVTIEFSLAALPIYPHTREMFESGIRCGNAAHNRAHVGAAIAGVAMAANGLVADPFFDELVHDPQTSGGLLIGVAKTRAAELLAALHASGVKDACVIGTVTEASQGFLQFVE